MADRDLPRVQVKRLCVPLTLAFILALAMVYAILALSASTAFRPALAEEAIAPAGPVCFFRDDYPICVERSGPDALATPGAVTPQALLSSLLAGPTDEEQAQGIESALPPGTQLVSVQTDGHSITVRLAYPDGYLKADPPANVARNSYGIDGLTTEAMLNQIFRTLFPLGYLDLFVEAQDPSTPGRFRPLSAFLPPVTLSPKGNSGAPDPAAPQSQPPVEVAGRPRGALSGKTVYLSAGHGWLWTGSNWRTQRSPSPNASTGYYGPIVEDHNNAETVNQYLLRYLWNAGADVWTARERDLNPVEQIVDDNHPGLVTSGVWDVATANGYLNGYLHTTTDQKAMALATWTVGPLPADGVYGLYVWYASGSNRTPDAHYTIEHAGGVTELTVDQRRHGYTWRYVGRFPARAGERVTVTLSNRSSMPGRVVVADAVRMGGGWFDDSDLAINGGGVRTNAPYAPEKPWWEAAAYYNVQRLGVNPDPFDSFNDVIARPLWARWEHAGTGEDAVFVSWHTNGRGGNSTAYSGTMSFIHNFQPVAGSAALRHAVHSELIRDIRAGWDPLWSDQGERSMDLGELRELWDEDGGSSLPGVLLEIAFHDHITDTNALKDPRFALLTARAVYQGIVKYFGPGLPLLPEPPTHLVVRNDGPGRIKVSWLPSPTDNIGLVGDAAESYRLYTSRDGLGWDNGRAVPGTETTLTGLPEHELIFVRVTAVNTGGESFPTPVLAARSSPDGVSRILVVDGFDRIDRHGLILEDDPTEGVNARLFPDRINSFDYVIQHAAHISLPFDSAVNEAVVGGNLNLKDYDILDWILGEESTVDRTFDPAEQATVAAYLEGGGGLLVSGAEIGWDLVTKENGPGFYHNYLRADMAGDDADTYQVIPTAAGIFAGLGPIGFRDSYDADFPDQLLSRNGSVAALSYLGGRGGIAALQYDAGDCRRVIYLAFPFETIAATKRPSVMARALSFLGGGACLAIPPRTTIAVPEHGGAYNFVPDLRGTAVGHYPVERVEVQIGSPDGSFWSGRGWVASPRWLAASGTTGWNYPFSSSLGGETSLEQGVYSIRARAWDTATLSDASPAFASFIYDTISPTVPVLLAPADGLTVTWAPTGFFWRGPQSDPGSAVGYVLQIDERSLTRPVANYIPVGGFAEGPHTWRVRAVDAAGNRSAWTASRTFVVDRREIFLPVISRN